MSMRTRNAVLLAKIETTEGTDAVPTATADATAIENVSFNPTADLVTTNEHTGSLDGQGSIVGGTRATLNFDVPIKGSGTAGTAPEWGRLLRLCSWAETLTATAIPAAPEAMTAGTTTSGTLGATAAATLQLYRGMPIVVTGVGAGTSFIADYTAAKVATLTDLMSTALTVGSSYQILVNVRYSPSSAASTPSGTFYLYMDGIRYRLYGARGTVSLRIDTAGIGRLSFQFQAVYGDKSDTAVPTNAVFDPTRPPVFRGGAFLIDRKKSAIAQVSMDVGNSLVMPGDPNAAEGFSVAEITARNITGSMNPLETLVATRDIMTAFRNGTKQIIHARYGSVAGNRVGLTIPNGLFTGQTPTDRDGLVAVDVPFEATGIDAGAFITLW